MRLRISNHFMMSTTEQIKEWINSNPFIWSVIRFLALVILILFIIQLLRRYFKKQISNTVIRYKAQKGVEILGYILLIFLAITYFSGAINST